MEISKIKMRAKNLIDYPLKLYDWIIICTFAFVCFFVFQHGDILHTGGSAIAYLNGHIWDFYDYNVAYVGGNAYLPSTYILFAIWDIPVRILGLITVPTMTVSKVVLFWYKLLPCLLYICSSVIIYKIGQEIGLGSHKAKLCMYVFISTPIGFFSQFLFGQYDVLTVFFVLLGLYYYFKEDTLKYVLFFGIAITFKYFAFFIFIPLLLLRYKNIWTLIKNAIFVMIPLAAEVLFYIHSAAFKNGVFGFGATNYIFAASIQLSHMQIKLIVLLWILLCGWAYFTDCLTKQDNVRWALYFCNIVTFIFFGLSMWHPQWLLFCVPFWVLSTFINKKIDFFLFLDILLALFYFGFTVVAFQHNVDQQLFLQGILSRYVSNVGVHFVMADLFIVKDPSLWYSAFSAILLINAIFKHPKFCLDDFNESIDKHWNLARARFVIGISIFIIPAIICLASGFILPKLEYSVPQDNITTINNSQYIEKYEQIIIPTRSSISQVDVQIGTYARTNHSKLQMTIAKEGTDKVLFTKDIDVASLKDNAFAKIKFAAVSVEKGQRYIITFKASGTSDTDYVTIYRTQSNTNPDAGYAIVDGAKQDYNLNIKVYGE